MFRNLRLYRLHSDWPDSEDSLSNALARAPFKPCGPYAERSMGWEAPVGDAGAAGEPPLARRLAGADLLRLRTQSRLLPAAAVKEALEDRIEEFRARTQRDPSRREKRDLKDEIHAELKPRALVKSDRTWGLCLLSEALIGIDTTSEVVAERFLEQLRAALGSLQVTPLEFSKPLSQLLTRVFLGQGPPAFRASDECRMVDPATGKASVTWLGMELGEPSVQKHVREGLKLDRLGVEFDGVLSCVIGQDASLRKLRLLGADVEDDDPEDNPIANLDAEFTVVAGFARRLLLALKRELGGYQKPSAA